MQHESLGGTVDGLHHPPDIETSREILPTFHDLQKNMIKS